MRANMSGAEQGALLRGYRDRALEYSTDPERPWFRAMGLSVLQEVLWRTADGGYALLQERRRAVRIGNMLLRVPTTVILAGNELEAEPSPQADIPMAEYLPPEEVRVPGVRTYGLYLNTDTPSVGAHTILKPGTRDHPLDDIRAALDNPRAWQRRLRTPTPIETEQLHSEMRRAAAGRFVEDIRRLRRPEPRWD